MEVNSDRLEKLDLNGGQHSNIFFNKRKSHHGKLRKKHEELKEEWPKEF